MRWTFSMMISIHVSMNLITSSLCWIVQLAHSFVMGFAIMDCMPIAFKQEHLYSLAKLLVKMVTKEDSCDLWSIMNMIIEEFPDNWSEKKVYPYSLQDWLDSTTGNAGSSKINSLGWRRSNMFDWGLYFFIKFLMSFDKLRFAPSLVS